jgi:general secretion pathway protein I
MWSWIGLRARSPSSSSARGFTLIEVLVAFAILALTLTALMQVFATGLRSADTIDRHLMATMLARSVLDDVGTEIPIVAGEQSADIEQGYRWTVRILPSGTIAPVVEAEWITALYEVQVEIAWNGRPVTTLTTLHLAAEPGAGFSGAGTAGPRQ